MDEKIEVVIWCLTVSLVAYSALYNGHTGLLIIIFLYTVLEYLNYKSGK